MGEEGLPESQTLFSRVGSTVWGEAQRATNAVPFKVMGREFMVTLKE